MKTRVNDKFPLEELTCQYYDICKFYDPKRCGYGDVCHYGFVFEEKYIYLRDMFREITEDYVSKENLKNQIKWI